MRRLVNDAGEDSRDASTLREDWLAIRGAAENEVPSEPSPISAADETAAQLLLKQISTYQTQHGGTLAKDCCPGMNDHPYSPPSYETYDIEATKQNNDGDVVAVAKDKLLDLIDPVKSGEPAVDDTFTPGSVYMPKPLGYRKILDHWGECFQIVLDADGDGIVRLGTGDPFQARAVVWSFGKNKEFDSGSHDDLVWILK